MRTATHGLIGSNSVNLIMKKSGFLGVGEKKSNQLSGVKIQGMSEH